MFSSPPLIDDIFQVRKINYNLRHFQKIANTKKINKKKLSKNGSRDNILPCTSIMELKFQQRLKILRLHQHSKRK